MHDLNHEIDPKLTANLEAIYTYCFDKLFYANVNDDLPSLEEVMTILTELRATWAEADLIAKSGKQGAKAA
jgi:flagellar protein FliS